MTLTKRVGLLMVLGIFCDISLSQDVTEGPFPLPSNFTLRKCACKANQVLEGSECVDQETVVPLYDMEQYRQELIGTSNFSEVTVGDVECPGGLFKATLSQNETLTLLTYDELYWGEELMIFTDYCVENVPYGLKARVCLAPPLVPTCCPPGHVLGPKDSCVERSNSDFFAHIEVNGVAFDSSGIINEYEREVTCTGIQVESYATLGTEEGNLMYSSGQALLVYQVPSYNQLVEPEENYCVGIDESNGTPKYKAKYCYTDPKEQHRHTCENVTCVRKCCPATFYLYGAQCLQDESVVWQPNFYDKQFLNNKTDAPENLLTVNGLPLCSAFFQLKPYEIETDKSYLLKDGTLHVPGHKDFPSDSYCVDFTMNNDGEVMETAVVCHEPNEECMWKGTLQVVLVSLSCVFLIATLAVYLGVADLRERTNGRCLISMTAAMLAAYVSLLVNNRETDPSDLHCELRGFFGHFFGLATFFWLNVMCFDMWSTLRSSQQQHQSKKTFLKYSIYAWGIPFVVAVTGRLMDNVRPEGYILPNFLEHKTCWFAVSSNAGYWLYFSAFILVLLLANLFFFIHVAITLGRKLRQRRSVFDNSSSRSSNKNKKQEQILLYVKLFIVMGVVWIADVASGIAHRNTCSFWIVFDIINGLQGVLIFLVAVCNKDNMKKFRGAWTPRIESVRTKISTIKGRSPQHKRRTTDASLATSEASRKTSVTSLPRKISTTSIPLNESGHRDIRHSSPPPRKISAANNMEAYPMHPIEE